MMPRCLRAFCLVAPFLCECSTAGRDYIADDDSMVPVIPSAMSGAAGSSTGPPVSVVVTPPCCVAGCGDGLVCDGTACVDPPASCPPGVQPVCGSDGHAYASACEANLAGVGVNPDVESCTPPDGYFACGDVFCAAATSFCNQSYTAAQKIGIPRESPKLGCLPLPGECVAEPSCSCVLVAADPPLDPCCSDASSGSPGVWVRACVYDP